MRLFSGDEAFLFSKNDDLCSKTLSSHIDSYFFTNDSNDNLNREKIKIKTMTQIQDLIYPIDCLIH